ncbi:glycosyltransferase family 2 protein [Liquorilactobacillus nagelii]|uniref:glycosyltransferase family 2 protein n=1 Tax=Liquorilactobacillus nagelii TaxID=82688 RepID=UPI0006F1B7FC|nr:glycosyltransferase family 2 protein [Liquorilactobacillus nagelii]KRL41532.1 hypothetical protein FD45_GL001053 [Liquorilactobacillus nagelii DSM 13675]QYH54138.1 glycosyltransferase family 2 protein [Liquorilactobacillus nagelii DSM 13675]
MGSDGKTCLILMATYNGEEYISEQLESIRNQTHSNWKLLIRDDNSSDKTIDIIKKYQKIDGRISLVKNNDGEHGAFVNFHELIILAKKMQSFDYYALSDQDDVWNEDKLEKLIVFLESKNKMPLLVYSDFSIINETGSLVLKSMNKKINLNFGNPINVFFSHEYMWGCTCMFNYLLLRRLPEISSEKVRKRNAFIHDGNLLKFAVIYGQAFFFDEALVNYRRHSSNASGDQQFKNGFGNAVRKVFMGYTSLCKTRAIVLSQTLTTLDLSLESKCAVLDVIEMKRKILKGSIFLTIYMLKKRVKRNHFFKTCALYATCFFNGYQKYLFDFKK